MAGHSKWAQIKHKKAAADLKRGRVFGKILNAISLTARESPDPKTNQRLRRLIEKAKENQIPQENIQQALRRTKDKNLQTIKIEAYGPGGAALIIEAVTDNSNRTINEIKHLLTQHQTKIAEPGSVQWLFTGNQPKFFQKINEADRRRLKILVEELTNHQDVQRILSNSAGGI